MRLRRKKKIDWYSSQVDDMWRKIDAGLEVRPYRFLR